MIKDKIDAVANFHKVFGLNHENAPTVNLSDKVIELRYNLMKEENEEYLQAAKTRTWLRLPTH